MEKNRKIKKNLELFGNNLKNISDNTFVGTAKENIDNLNKIKLELENNLQGCEDVQSKVEILKLIRQIEIDKINTSKHLDNILIKKYEIDVKAITEIKSDKTNKPIYLN